MKGGLAAKSAFPKTLMIESTYLDAHRTATSLKSKSEGRRPDGQRCRLIAQTVILPILMGHGRKIHAAGF
jgi:hypothetical protein